MTTTYVSLNDRPDCDKGTRFFLQDGRYYYKTRTEQDAWLSKEEVEINKTAFELVVNSSPALIGFTKATQQKIKLSVFENESFQIEYEASTCSLLMNIVYRLFPIYFRKMCKRKQERFEKAKLYQALINTRFEFQ